MVAQANIIILTETRHTTEDTKSTFNSQAETRRKKNYSKSKSDTLRWILRRSGASLVASAGGSAKSGGVLTLARGTQITGVATSMTGDSPQAGTGTQSATAWVPLPQGARLYISGVYWAPNSRPDRRILDNHIEDLKRHGFCPARDSLLIGGDLNVASRYWSAVPAAYTADRERRVIVESFIEENSHRVMARADGSPTRCHSDTAPDATLLVLPEREDIEEELDMAEAANASWFAESNGISDHKQLQFSIHTQLSPGGRLDRKLRNNYSDPERNAAYAEEARKHLETLLSEFSEEVSVDQHVQNLHCALVEAAKKTLPRGPRGGRLAVDKSISNELARQQANETFATLCRQSCEQSELPKLYSAIRSLDGRAKGGAAHAPPIGKPDGSYAVTLEAKAETFCRAYAKPPAKAPMERSEKKQLLRSIREQVKNEDGEEEARSAYSLDVIIQSITELENGKASPDGIDAEMFKMADRRLLSRLIQRICCQMLKTGEVASAMRTSTIIPIPKEGKRSLEAPNSWRPINLCSTLSKIIERVWLHNLMPKAEAGLPKTQFAYMQNRSTEQCVLRILDKLLRARDEGKYASLVQLDLSRAFESCCRKAIL